MPRACSVCGSDSYKQSRWSAGVVVSCSDRSGRALPQRHFTGQRAAASGTCGISAAGIVAGVHQVWQDADTTSWFHRDCAQRAWKQATR